MSVFAAEADFHIFMKRRKTWLKNMQADTSSAFIFSSLSGLIMSSEPQATAAPQAEPPGRMRRLWQALGRNRAGRLLRLAIIATIGWAAVESGIMLVSWLRYFSAPQGYEAAAINNAIGHAFGALGGRDGKLSAILPSPNLATDMCKQRAKKDPTILVDCMLPITEFKFSAAPCYPLGWAYPCRRYIYDASILQEADAFKVMQDAFEKPCDYLPSPLHLPAYPNTDRKTAEEITYRWRLLGCDGSPSRGKQRIEFEFRENGSRYGRIVGVVVAAISVH